MCMIFGFVFLKSEKSYYDVQNIGVHIYSINYTATNLFWFLSITCRDQPPVYKITQKNQNADEQWKNLDQSREV